MILVLKECFSTDRSRKPLICAFRIISLLFYAHSLDEEEGAEDIRMGGNAKVEESESVDDSTEEVASDDADVLDDIVGTDVLDDIADAEGVLGLNNFEDEEDDYYVGENDEDFGDLDAYDDNEGIY